MEWRMENGPTTNLEGRILVQNSVAAFCFLQPTDTTEFRGSKLYRRFESLPLRQQVLTAEKSRRLFPRNTRKMPIFRDSSSANRTAEKGPLDSEGGISLAFLWMAHGQSGFEAGIRRMQCDHKPAIRPRRVDFCQRLRNQGRLWPDLCRPPDSVSQWPQG